MVFHSIRWLINIFDVFDKCQLFFPANLYILYKNDVHIALCFFNLVLRIRYNVDKRNYSQLRDNEKGILCLSYAFLFDWSCCFYWSLIDFLLVCWLLLNHGSSVFYFVFLLFFLFSWILRPLSSFSSVN